MPGNDEKRIDRRQTAPRAWMTKVELRQGVIDILQKNGTLRDVIAYLNSKGEKAAHGTLAGFIQRERAQVNGPSWLLRFLESFTEEDARNALEPHKGKFKTQKRGKKFGRGTLRQRVTEKAALSTLREEKQNFSEETYRELAVVIAALESDSLNLVSGRYFKMTFGNFLDTSKGRPKSGIPIEELPRVKGASITVLVPTALIGTTKSTLVPKSAYQLAGLLKHEIENPTSNLYRALQNNVGRFDLMLKPPTGSIEVLLSISIPKNST